MYTWPCAAAQQSVNIEGAHDHTICGNSAAVTETAQLMIAVHMGARHRPTEGKDAQRYSWVCTPAQRSKLRIVVYGFAYGRVRAQNEFYI